MTNEKLKELQDICADGAAAIWPAKLTGQKGYDRRIFPFIKAAREHFHEVLDELVDLRRGRGIDGGSAELAKANQRIDELERELESTVSQLEELQGHLADLADAEEARARDEEQ